ncbi:hypothetical protein KZY93_000658 [Vibrio vulnificus]|nr:hypothetical protein [Vibrio vulnificus]
MNNNKKKRFSEYQKEFPLLTIAEIKRLATVLGNIKYRCGRVKGYETVQCEWQNLTDYLTFIVSEIERGRDFRLMRKFNTSRRGDSGNYSNENCQIIEQTENLKQAMCKKILVHVSNEDKPTYFSGGLLKFYKLNKDRLLKSISYATFIRHVHKNKIFNVQYGGIEGFIKIEILK